MISNPESIVGRADELAAIRSLVSAARNGMSGALVLRGEPGIGKTALLNAATADLVGIRVVRIDGYDAESSMPYAGLHRIGTELHEPLAELSPRHVDALRVAWGLDAGPPPDRYLVGLVSLALCAATGTHRPVVFVLDDAQWLDAESLSVLGFVARRLTAESTVFIFATRDNEDVDLALAGLASRRLTGLDQRAAVQLLTTVLPASIDPFSAVQIADATGGHPLALVDLARGYSLRQIDDLTLAGDPVPVSRRLETHYRAPLLFIGGENDFIMPPAVNKSNAKHYSKSPAVTEYYEFAGRDHWTCAAPGWEAVADHALDWALAYADTKPRGKHVS